MANLSNDWNNLATSVHNIGNDQMNAGLGLAKLLSEDALRKKQIEGLDAELQVKNLAIADKKRQDAFFDEPVQFGNAIATLTNGKITNESLAMSTDILPMLNISLADPNNPQSPIINDKGEVMTNRDFKDLSPIIGAYAATRIDPFDMMTKNMASVKEQLGFKSVGPMLNEAELVAAQGNPEGAKLLKNYMTTKDNYDHYSSTPQNQVLLYRDVYDTLGRLQSHIKSVKGDDSFVAAKMASVKKVIAQYEKQETEKQYPVTDKMSEATGLPTGSRMSEDMAIAGNTGLMGINKQEIASKASVEAATINAKQATLSTEQNAFWSSIDPNKVKLDISKQLELEFPVGPMGTRVKPDPENEGQVISMLPKELDDLINSRTAQAIQLKKQEAQDSGRAARLGINLTGVSKATPAVRQEFNTFTKGVQQELGTGNSAKDIVFKKNVVAQLNAIAISIHSGDPNQIQAARETMSSIMNQIKQYKESIKNEVPAKITKSARDVASGLIGLNDLGSFAP